MKLFRLSKYLGAGIALMLNACMECNSIKRSELTMAIDASDREQAEKIRSDIEQNFGTWIKSQGIANIGECEQFRLSIAPLSNDPSLHVSFQEISVPQRNLSYRDVERLRNPAPLANLLHSKLRDFEEMSESTLYNQGSNIGSNVLKLLLQTDSEADRSVVLVFSDLIENSLFANFYREMPTDLDFQASAQALIDPIILTELQERLRARPNIELIIVQQEPTELSMKANTGQLRRFWMEFFSSLGIDDVKFIDNLTNM